MTTARHAGDAGDAGFVPGSYLYYAPHCVFRALVVHISCISCISCTTSRALLFLMNLCPIPERECKALNKRASIRKAIRIGSLLAALRAGAERRRFRLGSVVESKATDEVTR